MTFWKYFLIKDPTKEQLNAIGENGWELVSVIFTKLLSDDGKPYHEFFFKRPFTEDEIEELENREKISEPENSEEQLINEELNKIIS